MNIKKILIGGAASFALIACGGSQSGDAPEARSGNGERAAISIPETPEARTVTIAADGFAENLQRALISAQEGDMIKLPEGTFNLTDGLSLDVDRVTLIGAGQDKSILNFDGQSGAGEGLLVTSDNVTLRDFTIQDTAGDGIKSKDANQIIYYNLTVEWTGEPDESNGAYGVYPVESEDILIEGVTVRGASDAGIYVGQSKNIIVRNSLAEYNVAGIEIENSIGADVYSNRAENNAGGILVFDLPDLPQVGGHSTRIYGNKILNNNTRNFAPPGNIVASVPSGTGVIIMANENVHVFNNELENNRTAHVLLTAYQDEFSDERYNPLPRNISVKTNTYVGGGDDPQGDLAPLAAAIGGQLPPVVWDGVTRWGEGEAINNNIVVDEAEEVGFLSLGLGAYPLDPASMQPSLERPVAARLERPAKIVLSHASGS